MRWMPHVLGLPLCIVWALALYGDGGPLRVAGPRDLREEFRDAQFDAPPSLDPLSYDAGVYVFDPDGSDADDLALAAGLIPQSAGGGALCPVTLYEDPFTRDTVFLNVLGEEILRIPPEDGYSQDWVLDALYPYGDVPADMMSAYDPSRVVMSALLAGFSDGPTSGAADAEPRRAVSGASKPLADAGIAVGTSLADGIAANGGSGVSQVQNGGVQGEAGAAGAADFAQQDAAPRYRSIYVDGFRGRDSRTGRFAVSADGGTDGTDGPKRTIRAGLSALGAGGVLVVLPGEYAESLDVRGTGADVRIEGDVVLRM